MSNSSGNLMSKNNRLPNELPSLNRRKLRQEVLEFGGGRGNNSSPSPKQEDYGAVMSVKIVNSKDSTISLNSNTDADNATTSPGLEPVTPFKHFELEDTAIKNIPSPTYITAMNSKMQVLAQTPGGFPVRQRPVKMKGSPIETVKSLEPKVFDFQLGDADNNYFEVDDDTPTLVRSGSAVREKKEMKHKTNNENPPSNLPNLRALSAEKIRVCFFFFSFLCTITTIFSRVQRPHLIPQMTR